MQTVSSKSKPSEFNSTYDIDHQRVLGGGWVVELSDGSRLYQTGPNAWAGLLEHLEETGLEINRLGVKFMDHEEWLPAGKDGYCAYNGVVGIYGLDWTVQKCNIGYVQDNQVLVKHYRKPEMLLVDEDERDLSQTENVWFKNGGKS